MQSFEHTGVWWLPGKFEDKVPGKLSFDPTTGESLDLRIEGHYLHTEFDNGVYPILLGIVDATKFSLTNCIIIDGYRRQTRDFVVRKRVFAIETIFEGHHFKSIDDIAFEYISASYTYLDDWMDQRNFRFEDGSVNYLQPEATTIQLEDVSISFSAGVRESIRRTKVVMKEVCWVNVTPNEERHFDEYRQLVDIQLPNFLTLATGMPNYPSSVGTVFAKGEIPQDVNIYYQVPGYFDKPPPIIVEYMLFVFEDVRNCPSKYLPTWIAKSEQLLSVSELYFQTIYKGRSLSAKTGFLLLAQALEAYHRNLHGGKYLPSNKYRPVQQKLKNAIPDWFEDEHRNNLKAAIDNGNDYSLKTRIIRICEEILRNYLVDSNYAIIDSLLTDAEGFSDKDGFPEKVKTTRNYLTHHPKKRPKNVIPDDEIPLYVAKLRFILRICFLVELGFPPDQIKKRVMKNPEFRTLTGRW